MRSPELLLAAALLLALPGVASAEAPTRQEVQQAADTVRQHPDLGGTRTQRSLRFKPSQRPDAPASRDDLRWLVDALRALSEGSRVLVWLLGAAVAAYVLLRLRRWMAMRGGFALARRPHLPSHVQSLDIRPESLPHDIGAEAAARWQRGEHRAALSLLYRGALSRLVHAHAVPIRAASTEGECVALARSRLASDRSAYFARLVGAWQLAVYGSRLPDTAQTLALCRDFEQQLPGATP